MNKLASITPAMNSAANAYLMARTYAEIMREKVDKVEREILIEAPLTNGYETKHGKSPRPITEPKDVYLCNDELLLQDYYAEVNKRERAAGLKPDNMPDEFCPALIAENAQIKAEQILIDVTAEMLGEKDNFRQKLLCAGLKKYHQFIDLAMKLIASSPEFKSVAF